MSSPDQGPGAPPPNPTTQPPTGQAPEVPATGQTGSPAPAESEIADLRKESAKWRTELRKAQDELEKLKAASLTDSEKAIAEAKAAGAAEYQTKWRQALLDNAALTLLASKNVTAADLALRSIDYSDVDVDTTTGKVDVASLEKRVDELLQRYPMLAPEHRPGLGTFTGADQTRIQSTQLAGSGKSEQDRLNELARYALGRGD